MKNIIGAINEKKAQLDLQQPHPQELLRNLQEWFKVELTFTSNAIEGNTLSRSDTALIVENGITVEGKSIREHLEAVNHAQAFDWLTSKSNLSYLDVSETMILQLHQIILQKIDDISAGHYRSVAVRIAGSRAVMPNPLKVPELMSEFVEWLHFKELPAITRAVEAHFSLVSIHPFTDGNGRTARLLMNLLLMQAGYPPAIIPKEKRRQYISSLESAQVGGSKAQYFQIMYQAINNSLDIYLKAFTNHEELNDLQEKKLLKIGELAKLTGETTATIRYWTKFGVLDVSSYSKGGYQLYGKEAIQKVKNINQLKTEKRLTLEEIKRKIQ